MPNTLIVAYDIAKLSEPEFAELLKMVLDARPRPQQSILTTFNVLGTPFMKIRGRLDELELLEEPMRNAELHSCRICGCTSINCFKCIVRTGQPCSWIEINGMPTDLCTACAPPKEDGDKKDNRIPLSRLKVIAKQGNTEACRIIDELLVLRGAV